MLCFVLTWVFDLEEVRDRCFDLLYGGKVSPSSSESAGEAYEEKP